MIPAELEIIEEKLLVSEVKFRRLFETTRNGLLLIDPVTEKIIDANPYFLEMKGYSLGETMGKKLWEVGVFRDIEAAKTIFKELKTKGFVRYEDLPLQNKDGREIDVEFVSNLYVINSAKSLVSMIQCNISNITERKLIEKKAETYLAELERAEYELGVEKAKMEKFMDSIGDGVIAIDRNWNIIEWNDAASSLTGWTREEALHKPFRERIHFVRARDRSENVLFIEDALIYGRIRPMENHTLLVRKDKKEIAVGDSAAPIFDENKKVIGAIIIFRDLTKELNSQAMRVDFQYAAHQLRTPATNILWCLEIVLGSKLDKKTEEFIEHARDSAKSIAKMADQLLSVAEIDQSIVIPKYEIVNMSEIIAETFKKVDPAAKKKDVKLLYQNIVPINLEADIKLIKTVFWEIMDNAINYNKDKGEVIVEVQEREEGILVEVRDTGLGITDEQQPLIFTKFFRGNNYDAGKIPGSGLGLFVSRAYAQLMKGKIWFKSEPGKGTSFFVLLPKLREKIG